MTTLYNIFKNLFTVLLFILGAVLAVCLWVLGLAFGSMNDRLEADIIATRAEWFDDRYDGSFGRSS
mgnify:CR=1 FL=1|tara:strand:+ start:865 stop:1062 length:198 start_codon:yes stop_codon:yes gene_type:complete